MSRLTTRRCDCAPAIIRGHSFITYAQIWGFQTHSLTPVRTDYDVSMTTMHWRTHGPWPPYPFRCVRTKWMAPYGLSRFHTSAHALHELQRYVISTHSSCFWQAKSRLGHATQVLDVYMYDYFFVWSAVRVPHSSLQWIGTHFLNRIWTILARSKRIIIQLKWHDCRNLLFYVGKSNVISVQYLWVIGCLQPSGNCACRWCRVSVIRHAWLVQQLLLWSYSNA